MKKNPGRKERRQGIIKDEQKVGSASQIAKQKRLEEQQTFVSLARQKRNERIKELEEKWSNITRKERKELVRIKE